MSAKVRTLAAMRAPINSRPIRRRSGRVTSGATASRFGDDSALKYHVGRHEGRHQVLLPAGGLMSAIAVAPSDSTLVAFTHGRGVWRVDIR
jgi:hypothetical protein